jgi:hypothetical protein
MACRVPGIIATLHPVCATTWIFVMTKMSAQRIFATELATASTLTTIAMTVIHVPQIGADTEAETVIMHP